MAKETKPIAGSKGFVAEPTQIKKCKCGRRFVSKYSSFCCQCRDLDRVTHASNIPETAPNEED